MLAELGLAVSGSTGSGLPQSDGAILPRVNAGIVKQASSWCTHQPFLRSGNWTPARLTVLAMEYMQMQ
jgi:hypothetical protein